MFERFTDRARRVVVLAQEEARMLNHNYIGTEHIQLGLIHEGEGVACQSAAATLLEDGLVLMAGGIDGISGFATAELYDPIAGRGRRRDR